MVVVGDLPVRPVPENRGLTYVANLFPPVYLSLVMFPPSPPPADYPLFLGVG